MSETNSEVINEETFQEKVFAGDRTSTTKLDLEVSDGNEQYSKGCSLDYSSLGSVFESEDCDTSIFEADEHESGVESVDGDWLQSCNTPPSEFELDLTEEQALETLKYFTLSVSRANQMTKTHQDLEAVLQLLQEKEKDLELAAHIGQSLLERNKNLYKKTEALEDYVNEVEERELQLKHVVTMKDKLLKTFIDEDLDDDEYSTTESSAYGSCRDESMMSLQEKCERLEEHNTSLIVEALKLRQETDEVEEKEKELVYECIKELAEAKDQISHLTDEISWKAEDNIAQQEEISNLIETVLELQKQHNMLTEENEGLQETLKSSQENQNDLKVEVTTLHEKYQECYEMLMENQREMKAMKEKLGKGTGNEDGSAVSRPDSRDSLAQEIEESVRRDIETSQEKKKHTDRVMQTVRAANTKRFPKAIKGGTRPAKNKAGQGSETKPFDFSFATSPRDEQEKSPPSMDQLRAAVRRLSVNGENAAPQGRSRRAWAPEKLQIVKPMEGSATLHKWQSLAKPTMSGLHAVVPGVHVKGEITHKDKTKHEANQGNTNRNEKDTNRNEKDTKLGENIKQAAVMQMDKNKYETNMSKNDNDGKIGKNTKDQDTSKNTKTANKNTNKGAKLQDKSKDNIEEKAKQPAHMLEEKKTTVSDTTAVTSNTSVVTSNLTEIVKSKLSAENVLSPDSEPGLILNRIIQSTVDVSSGFASSTPVTTTAKSTFVTTTTTSSSMAVSAFPRPLHRRSRSSENILALMAPFNQSTESVSTNASTESLPVAPPVSSGAGFGGFVGRLVRSSSNENLAGDLSSGFSQSSGKLSDLLKNSDIAQNIGKASSVDTMSKKRASFHLGDSPLTASHLSEVMGDLGGIGYLTGDRGNPSPPATETPPVQPTTRTSRSMFDAFSGLGGFFRPRSKSLDNLGPLPTSITSPRSIPSPGRKAPVERSLERFDQVFGPG